MVNRPQQGWEPWVREWIENESKRTSEPQGWQGKRFEALCRLGLGDYEQAYQTFHEVRALTQGDNDATQYYHWEARYLALVCLEKMGRGGEASHAAEVLIKSQVSGDDRWLKRIGAMVQGEAGGLEDSPNRRQ